MVLSNPQPLDRSIVYYLLVSHKLTISITTYFSFFAFALIIVHPYTDNQPIANSNLPSEEHTYLSTSVLFSFRFQGYVNSIF